MGRPATVIPKGTKYGRLTVLGRAANVGVSAAWTCKCECGTKKVVRSSHLTSGFIESCGCLKIERIKKANTKHGEAQNVTARGSVLWNRWASIKGRVGTEGYYENVFLHPEWEDYKVFKKYVMKTIGLPPTAKHQIDRINNSGNYEPGNIRWATPKVNCNNRRSSVNITYRGETKTIAEWSDHTGIPYHTLFARLTRLKWPKRKAFTTPVRATNG